MISLNYKKPLFTNNEQSRKREQQIKMNKNMKNKEETEEPCYKYCYGKWIKIQETKKPED